MPLTFTHKSTTKIKPRLLFQPDLNGMDMATQSIFGDKRLDKEFNRLVTDISSTGSSVINRACGEAGRKKAAYRFINNKNVTVERVVHDLVNQCVRNIKRMAVTDVLVAQDTMETVRENVLGRLKKSGKTVLECARTNKGMRSHSAIVMNGADGVPLGFGYLKIWGRTPRPLSEINREGFRTDRKRQPSYYIADPETGRTRYKYSVPLAERESESARWIDSAGYVRDKLPADVHMTMVQDREGDMYPLLTLPDELPNFDIVVRASKRRKVRVGNNDRRDIFDYTRSTPVRGTVAVTVGKGPRKKARKVRADVRYGDIEILRPHSPRYPRKSVKMCFVRVSETGAASKDGAVDWLLLTSLDVTDNDDAARIIACYKRRWFIEDFHRLLKKKGFGIEDIQVESPHAFEINLAASIKSAYEVALVKKGFDGNDDTDPASIAFTPLEIEIADTLNRRFNPDRKIHKNPHPKGSLAWASWVVACEGGWSAMPSQPRPGIITFKRGIDRLETIYQYLLDNSNNRDTCG